MNPKVRDDISRFLVHLTRDYAGLSAQENLCSILRAKTVKARNAHCLFHHKLVQYSASDVLRKKFRTVCLTEAPFPQIRFLAQEVPGRNIRLKPFGLVFRKEDLLEKGASPAIYLNAKGTSLREYLLSEFARHFKKRSQYKTLKRDFGQDADSIINYYALINVVSDRYDFSWEREWRYPGNLHFEFHELYAIIAAEPRKFLEVCQKCLKGPVLRALKRLPIISPDWNYERVLENYAVKLWNRE